MRPARRQLILGAAAPSLAGALRTDSLRRTHAATQTLNLAPPASPPQPTAATIPPPEFRREGLHNLHTGDKVDAVYWESGAYVPSTLVQVQRIMRD